MTGWEVGLLIVVGVLVVFVICLFGAAPVNHYGRRLDGALDRWEARWKAKG